MLRDAQSISSEGPATFALLACGCYTFYVGHDIAPGDQLICPSLARCTNAGRLRATVTATLVGTVPSTSK